MIMSGAKFGSEDQLGSCLSKYICNAAKAGSSGE